MRLSPTTIRRTITITGLVCIFSLAVASFSFADITTQFKEGLNVAAKPSFGESPTQGDATTLASKIGTALNYLMGTVAAIFLTIVLIGGYQWLTAGGKEEKVEHGKKFIINGVNGMIVIFIAYALAYLILAALKNAIG